MAYQLMWYKTEIPKDIVDIFVRDSQKFQKDLKRAGVGKDEDNFLPVRDSKCSWISDNHWISGMCYHYLLKANMENFKYDIDLIGNKEIQYTSYETGEYYNWHVDTSTSIQHGDTGNKELDFIKYNSQKVRKLSFSVQLSDPEDYTGGELQILSDENVSYFAPKTKGTIIIFDSRMRHRVRKVTSGCRKSLVGWVEGPTWK